MAIIKRRQFDLIQEHLKQKEITLIIGPRQVGKTTLMKKLEENLINRGERTLFLDLDREQDRQFFNSQARLIQKIVYDLGKEKGYVFIDEIQRKENAGVFLKGIYDMNLPYKLIVSGSGSLELKEKIHESLAGRKRIFELSPLGFKEFIDFKTDYKYTIDATFFDLYEDTVLRLFEEYLSFGGYPRVVLEPEINEKRAAIDEIYRSFLEKDIFVLLNIQKTEQFTQLIRILAAQTGNLVNLTEFSNTLGLAVQTIKDYLWYLEKTFIIQKVTPYFRNIRKEITKAPAYYFVDLGLKNFAANQFGSGVVTSTLGFLFENFVYNILKETIYLSSATIHFWRTKDNAEVDFVIAKGINVIPIEVKYTYLKEPKISRSYRNFIARYKPQIGYVIHLGDEKKIQINGTTIHFLPYYSLIETINL